MSLAAAVGVVIQISTGLLLVGLISLAFAVFVLVDMARRPSWQWQQARSNKTTWIVLEVLLLVLFGPLAIVVGVLYFVIARPRLLAAERQGPVPPGWSGGGQWPQTGWPPQGGPGWPSGTPPPGWPQGVPPPPSPGGGPPPDPGGAPPPDPGGAPPAGAPPAYPPYPATDGAPPYPPTLPQPAPPPQPVEETSRPLFGWYPDPSGAHEKRYWDGTTWTEHVSDGDDRTIDPLPS